MLTESVKIYCSFPACPGGAAKYQTFDISPTHPDSVSGPRLRPPGNCPVLSLYGLSDTLSVLSCTVTVLTGRTSLPVVVKYLNTTSRQALRTNPLYLKRNRPVVNISNLTWTLPIKTRSLPVFNHKVSYILGQAGNTSRKAVNRNR